MSMPQVRGMSVTSRISGPGRFSEGISHSWGIRAARSATLRSRMDCQGGEDIDEGGKDVIDRLVASGDGTRGGHGILGLDRLICRDALDPRLCL